MSIFPGRHTQSGLHPHGSDPQAVLPTQTDRGVSFGGEQRLLLAVLEEARRVLRYPPESPLYRDALAWVHGAPGPLTFPYVCHNLGLDPEWVRPRLLDSAKGKRLISMGLGRGYSGTRTVTHTVPTLWLRRGLAASA